jgi:carboxypeptidase family protein
MSGKSMLIVLAVFLLFANFLLLVYLGGGNFSARARNDDLRELRGTITAETGAGVAVASLTLSGTDHGYSTASDNQGRFRFIGLAPGIYSLTVTANGFGRLTEQVDLSSRRADPIKIMLRVFAGGKVDVKQAQPSTKAEGDKNLSSIVLAGKDLQALPDDPSRLIEEPLHKACPSCNPDEVALQINGFSSDGSGKPNRLSPKDATQMIRIGANPTAAEFQEQGHVHIDVTTKPGSDDLHGEAAVRFSDESLNARNAMARARAPLQLRNYSGYLTGPAVRDRFDFLAYARRWEQDENAVINARTFNIITLQPQTFSTTVVTPLRTNNFTLRSNYLASQKHTLAAEYSYASETARNQGLESGLDLPERAFRRSTRENALRFSLTSIQSERTINEGFIRFARTSYGTQSLNSDPAILVLDAFNAGGNQTSLFINNMSHSLQLADNLTRIFDNHMLKLGLRADAIYIKSTDRANFNGTFIFGTDVNRDALGAPAFSTGGETTLITPLENFRRAKLGLSGYGPSQLIIVGADPTVHLTQWQLGWFIQDDWRIAPRLTLSYGLRHDFQTHLADKMNLAPRASVAWVPDKAEKSTVRAGAGLFYSTVFSDITLTTARPTEELRIQQPGFFPVIPITFDGATVALPTIYTKAPGMKAPYSIIATASYERQLPRNLFGSVSYTWQRGLHLLRTRNVTAPGPLAAPNSSSGVNLQYESTGKASRHELMLGLRGNIGSRVTLFSNYALSRTRSDTDDPNAAPANSYDLASDFSYASFDRRHSFYFGGTLSLPQSMSISPFVSLMSGQPFNITTGRDNNGDTIFMDRPAFAVQGGPYALATRFGVFNPNPLPGDPIIGRNFARAPGQAIVNLNFSKTFLLDWISRRRAQQSYSLVFDINIENLFNRTNLIGFNGVLTSPLFGRANRALNGRRVEFALSFSF